MPSFNDFFKALLGNIEQFAATAWKDQKDAALKDGNAFVTKARQDLERWTDLFAKGQLTKDDFGFLVRGKKDVAELEALKQAGLAAARLDGFLNGLFKVVVDTAVGVFL